MKRRTWYVGLGVLLLTPVAVLAVLRLPVTQGWLLRRAVAGVPGLALKVDRVSAGLSGAELRGIEADYEGTTLRLPLVRASYDGWALLTRRELIVDEFQATNAEVVLPSGAAGAGASAAGNVPVAAAQGFAGLLAPLQLPMKTTVGAVQIGAFLKLSEFQTARVSSRGGCSSRARSARPTSTSSIPILPKPPQRPGSTGSGDLRSRRTRAGRSRASDSRVRWRCPIPGPARPSTGW